MKELDILQICRLIKLGKVVNSNTSLNAAVEEVNDIVGRPQIDEEDYDILIAFFMGLTAHEDK